MNKANITKEQMRLILSTLTARHWQLEQEGAAGTDEHRALRGLEETLGTLQGDAFVIEGHTKS